MSLRNWIPDLDLERVLIELLYLCQLLLLLNESRNIFLQEMTNFLMLNLQGFYLCRLDLLIEGSSLLRMERERNFVKLGHTNFLDFEEVLL